MPNTIVRAAHLRLAQLQAPAPVFGDRTLKLARTTPARAVQGARVADLAGSATSAGTSLSSEPGSQGPGCSAKRIETSHLAEAIQYRRRWQV